MKPMKRSDFIKYVKTKANDKLETDVVSKDQTTAVVDAMVESIVELVTSGEEVKFTKLGKFYQDVYEERPAVHPVTGEPITLKARMIPKFKPSASFYRIVKNQGVEL